MAALSLSMTRDKTAVFYLSVFQYDGMTPQSLVGSTLYFHAGNGSFTIEKNSSAAGIDITNTAGGSNCATLTIEAEDTAALGAHGTYAMDCELTLVNSGKPYELNSGTLRILPNVGTP